MIIAVENVDLAKKLSGMGYIVKNVTYNGYVDAVIYEKSNVIENNMSLFAVSPTLIINSQSKNAGEIDTILKTRLYSPLF